MVDIHCFVMYCNVIIIFIVSPSRIDCLDRTCGPSVATPHSMKRTQKKYEKHEEQQRRGRNSNNRSYIYENYNPQAQTIGRLGIEQSIHIMLVCQAKAVGSVKQTIPQSQQDLLLRSTELICWAGVGGLPKGGSCYHPLDVRKFPNSGSFVLWLLDKSPEPLGQLSLPSFRLRAS